MMIRSTYTMSICLCLLMLSAAPAAVAQAAPPEPLWPVANPYEERAIEEGQELGIGSAVLEGPKVVEVDSFQTFTLAYTAGKAGIRPGGGLRVGLRHVARWSPLQTNRPKAPGYVTVTTSNGAPVRVTTGRQSRFFRIHFPWQTMVEVILPEEGLAPGETIRITYGDRSAGSPGVRVQPFDERRFVFKVYVDVLGNARFLPLAENPVIRVVPAAPYCLRLVMPSDAVKGQSTWCIVRAEDRYGNPAVDYRGTVRFTSSDPAANLPAAYQFTADDGGVHRFENIGFGTAGCNTITASDGHLRAEGNPVQVHRQRPGLLLLWGDLHGHTLHSDGRGTVEEYYEFARNFSGLDFCAVSDHAFQMVDPMWEHSKRVTNRYNEPGRFVTFNAYEWSGNTPVGGDHNVYFLDDDPPLWRSDNYYTPENLQMYHGPDPKVPHVEQLFAKIHQRLDGKNVLCIPHWGGRHGNPQYHDPAVQRLIEVFSEHRRSEDWAGTFLAAGHRLGIMASGDDHFGNPGHGYLRPTGNWDTQEIGMAAVAVYAPERTRQAIFHALYDRHTYATSGDRIVLAFSVDGHPMGSEFRTQQPPTVEVLVLGTAPIEQVQIKRNGQIVYTAQPGARQFRCRWTDEQFQPGTACYYYVRVVQGNNEEAISSPVWLN